MTHDRGRTARRSARARLSTRALLVIFAGVMALVVALAVAVTLLASRPEEPGCPDPRGPCAQPPRDGVEAGTLADGRGSVGAVPMGAETPSGVETPSGAETPSESPTAAPSPGVSPSPSPDASPSPSLGGSPAPSPAASPNALTRHPFRDRTPLTSELAYRTEYDPVIWTVVEQTGRSFVATMAEGRITGRIDGAPTAELSVAAAIAARRSAFAESILGLAEERSSSRTIGGVPYLGSVPASLVLFDGSLDSPQGPSGSVTAFILAASDGQITIAVSGVIDDDDRELGLKRIDSWLNQLRWPAEVGP